jgi:hypothetical protein
LIFGDSAETPETVMETLDWYLRHRPYQINMNFILTYPGTELYKRAIQQGLIKDRLAFIENGCPMINLTGMTSETWNELKLRVQDYIRLYDHYPGRLISFELTGKDVHGEDMYTITAECPTCKAISVFKNISDRQSSNLHYISAGVTKLGCRNCHQNFDVPLLLELKIRTIINGSKPGRVALWGAGAHTRDLLKFMHLTPDEIRAIYDTETGNCCCDIEGIPMEIYPDDPGSVREKTDDIIIISPIGQDDIISKLSPLKSLGLRIHRLYDAELSVVNFILPPPTPRFVQKLKTLFHPENDQRVAIWGAGGKTMQLIDQYGLSGKEVTQIFDNDTGKHGGFVNSIPVSGLRNSPEEMKRLADIIVICSAYEQDIYRQISYLENHGIEIFRLDAEIHHSGF